MKAKDNALQAARDLMRLQHKSINTEKTYLHWIGKYIDWLIEHGGKLTNSRARIEAFLTSIAHAHADRILSPLES